MTKSFMPDESNNLDVFDEEVGTDRKGCSLCGLGTKTAMFGKDLMGKDAHLICIKDAIEAGSYDLETISVLELNNGIHDHSLSILHPDVKEEGCVFCHGEMVDTADLVSRHPEPKFAHRACIAAEIRKGMLSGETIQHLMSLNNLTDFPAWFNKQAWKCTGCDEVVVAPTISPIGDLYHKECMKREIKAGRINSWDIVKICEINGLAAEDLKSYAPQFSETTSDLIKEAKGIISDLWQRFTTWLEEVYHSAVDALYGYDRGLDLMDGALSLSSRTASLNKVSIEPDVQQAMEILAKLEKLEDEHERQIEALKALYQIKSLDKAKKALAQKIKDYINTLSSKQRKFEGAIFRLKDVVHKETVSYKEFLEALRAAYMNQTDVTGKINELITAATHASFTTQEVEILMEEVPPEVAPQVPQSAPAAVPTEGVTNV